jgi:phage major head subunit gpT-like protein
MAMTGTVTNYNMFDHVMVDSFQKGIKETPEVGKDLYEEIPSGTASLVHTWTNFASGMKLYKKGDAKASANLERFSYSIENAHYYNMLTVDKDDLADEMFGAYEINIKNMAIQAKTLKGKKIFNLFNNAFASTLSYDGAAWCSASHTLGQSTINNLRTGALSTANFDEAYEALLGFTMFPDDATEDPVVLNDLNRVALVVSPTNLMTAREIVVAKTIGEGVDNIRSGLGVDIIINPYATTSAQKAYWFLVNVGAGIKPTMWQRRTEPTLTNTANLNDTESIKRNGITYCVDMRGAALPTFPHLLIGSTGAA